MARWVDPDFPPPHKGSEISIGVVENDEVIGNLVKKMRPNEVIVVWGHQHQPSVILEAFQVAQELQRRNLCLAAQLLTYNVGDTQPQNYFDVFFSGKKTIGVGYPSNERPYQPQDLAGMICRVVDKSNVPAFC